METELGEDTRTAILGHVQPGRAPSVRSIPAALLGRAAVERLLTESPDATAQLIGLGGNRVVSSPLMDCVAKTQAVAAPRPTPAGRRRFRLAVVHGRGPAPGMNNSVRTAVRPALDRDDTPLAVQNEFLGLQDGGIQEMSWMDVSGWVYDGGAEIGTNRYRHHW